MKAFAYYRTTSAIHLPDSQRTLKSQQMAVDCYAIRNKITLTASYYDQGLGKSDLVAERPGFKALLNDIAGMDVQAILIENPNRLSREFLVQLTVYQKLKQLGLALIPVDLPSYFLEETASSDLVQQIMGVIDQFDRNLLLLKLKDGRAVKRKKFGKCEGRKSIRELHPELIRKAKHLRRKNIKTGKRLSYRKIAEQFAEEGYKTNHGNVYSGAMIRRLVT